MMAVAVDRAVTDNVASSAGTQSWGGPRAGRAALPAGGGAGASALLLGPLARPGGAQECLACTPSSSHSTSWSSAATDSKTFMNVGAQVW
jgi:hypothetical protein